MQIDKKAKKQTVLFELTKAEKAWLKWYADLHPIARGNISLFIRLKCGIDGLKTIPLKSKK